MKVFLLLIIILQGQEPKMMQKEMPDLEHCIEAAYAFLKDPKVAKTFTDGGVQQAGCSVVHEGRPV